ncbi:MAG: 2-succinyl-5-enolpyruvyl-6-hydroxy-3-cyclohexene-1-carboxylate synthase [Candidatus Nanopelagicaceae bacterium]|jgi:2-succinyl-5-enolpyruvyl-6-hydroxy-3-cyclohexene-1-carboxylate synthase
MASTELARKIIRDFIEHGITEFVLSPGSRNAPLSIALYEADKRGLVNLHIRIDERTAAFFALGITKATKNPAVVVCTSGTAVANYYPAFLEAFHSDLPLIVLSADRPARLRQTGANQTTNQVKLFNCGRYFDGGSYELHPDGPTHINVEFDEPLLSEDKSDWLANLSAKQLAKIDHQIAEFEAPKGRGILIIGHDGVDVSDFAKELAVPVIAENPLSYPEAIPHAALFSNKLEIDWAVVVGRTTLSRSTNALIAKAKEVYVIDPRAAKIDPKRSATKIFSFVPKLIGKAESWQITSDLIKLNTWSEPAVAQTIAETLPNGATLYVASSRPIRDLEAFAAPRSGVEVFANRGLAGIDGNISTALGIASKRNATYAILGDLAFLHDLTALVNQELIKLKLLVINNDGGGIFSTLPQAGVDGFEKIFGTAHGHDLAAIAQSFKVPVTEVSSLNQLKQFLTPPTKFEIAVLKMPNRSENANLIKELAQRVNYR